ncbi:MAG: Tar ligand binding domain-containing protein, partial [Sulfuricellaceae bacterium]
MFNNLTIKSRLIFLIGLMSVLLIGIGVLGLRGMSASNAGLATVYQDRLVPSSQLAIINNLMAENVRQVHLSAMHDPRLPESSLHDHPLSFHTDKIKENIQKITNIWGEYMATYLTPEEKQLADEYAAKRKVFVQQGLLGAVDLFTAGKFAEGNAHLVKVVGPTYAEAKGLAEKLLQLQVDVAKAEYDKAVQNYQKTRLLAIGAIVIGVSLALLVGILLLRNIGNALAQAGDVAKKIAHGDLSSKIEIKQHDEVGVLLQAMAEMQDAINAFVAAQGVMAQKHAEGWISERMDASKFPGTYGKMAEELNELVASHIAVKMKVVEVISQYAKGDFSRDMDRLPGEKAKITNAMDGVKNALLSISSDIKKLAELGAKGDFSQRGDESKYEFMFKDMVGDMNTLIDTCDVGFNDVMRVAKALAAGDLSQKITKDYPGVFGQTKDAVNGTVDALTQIVAEIQQIVEAAAVRGDFSVKMNMAGKAGYTK